MFEFETTEIIIPAHYKSVLHAKLTSKFLLRTASLKTYKSPPPPPPTSLKKDRHPHIKWQR